MKNGSLTPVQIAIKTITDYHLESFARCPNQFYYNHVLQLSPGKHWKQAVLFACHHVIHGYHQLPPECRTVGNILTLIEKAWRPIGFQMFDSAAHYYTVIAKTTDHLLEFLTKGNRTEPPLLLYQKLTAYIKELETQLSITFEIVEWSSQTFVIKKFLVEADDEILQLYYHLLVVFANKVFETLPENIVMMTLLDGKKQVFTPREKDIPESMQYLQKMKYLLQHVPEEFTQNCAFKKCHHCPFVAKCQEDSYKTKRKRHKLSKTIH